MSSPFIYNTDVGVCVQIESCNCFCSTEIFLDVYMHIYFYLLFSFDYTFSIFFLINSTMCLLFFCLFIRLYLYIVDSRATNDTTKANRWTTSWHSGVNRWRVWKVRECLYLVGFFITWNSLFSYKRQLQHGSWIEVTTHCLCRNGSCGFFYIE